MNDTCVPIRSRKTQNLFVKSVLNFDPVFASVLDASWNDLAGTSVPGAQERLSDVNVDNSISGPIMKLN
jgi:hypothetical protein